MPAWVLRVLVLRGFGKASSGHYDWGELGVDRVRPRCRCADCAQRAIGSGVQIYILGVNQLDWARTQE